MARNDRTSHRSSACEVLVTIAVSACRLMRAWLAILVGLLSCTITAHSQQAPTSTCPSVQSLKLPDESAKELSEYVRTIADSVSRTWNVTSDAASNKSWSALAQVKVEKDGQVSSATITASSGDALTDQAATDTIRRASPFAPLPVSANVECIGIGLNFSYAPGQKVLVTTGGGVYRVGGGVSAPPSDFQSRSRVQRRSTKSKT